MTAAAQTQTAGTIDDDAISARLQQYDNVKIITSIERIGEGLAYLAQCDYAFGNGNSHLLCDDSHFGRGYLLDMLSSGVNNFAREFEQTEALFNQYRQQSENLNTQNSKMQLLVEKYQQLLAIDDKSSGKALELQRQIDALKS